MTPVYQTKHGPPDGNCFAACVASLLDRGIEEVDVDVASCGNSLRALLMKIEQKANCIIYYATHEAILHGILKTPERYCFAEVCTCVFNGNPYGEGSTWHVALALTRKDPVLLTKIDPPSLRNEDYQRRRELWSLGA